MVATYDPESPASQRTGYSSLAIGIAVFVVLAFVPTYWLPMASGSSSTGMAVHLHASLFFVWAMLFGVQSVLIAKRNVLIHRRVGIVLSIWSVFAVIAGFYVAGLTIARDIALIDGTIRGATTMIALTQVSMFTLFIGLGIAFRHSPEYHKRLMVLAALVAVTPAIARLPIAVFGIGAIQVAPVTFILSTGLLLAVVWYDARGSGKLHAVFLWGALTIVAVRIMRIPFSTSDAWRSGAENIASWMG